MNDATIVQDFELAERTSRLPSEAVFVGYHRLVNTLVGEDMAIVVNAVAPTRLPADSLMRMTALVHDNVRKDLRSLYL